MYPEIYAAIRAIPCQANVTAGGLELAGWRAYSAKKCAFVGLDRACYAGLHA